MRTFFIQVDPVMWVNHFLPAFCEQLEDAPDTVDCLIGIVKEYVLFRHETTNNILEGIVDGAQESPEEITTLVLDNENISYVDIPYFASLLEDLYRSIYTSLAQLGPAEGFRNFQTHQNDTVLVGFSGCQVLQ